MRTDAERRKKNDMRVAADVRRYGCHVISVFDPDEKQPSFSYSIGIQETSGVPEAIVIGLCPELGGYIINEYNRKVRSRKKFRRGILYRGFLKGFSVYVEPVLRRRNEQYTYGCDRYYKGKPYSAVQIIYPNTGGVWPWSRAADAWFKANQPMLGRVRPNRP